MLIETVRLARNDVVHGGAYVRHLTDRLVELINILEDAAMAKLLNVNDIMVRDVASRGMAKYPLYPQELC